VILSKAKSIEKKLDKEKKEEKIKRQLTREKRLKLEKDHVRPDAFHPELEKRLRRVATRGGKIQLSSILITK
jgi:hypothetical protein